MNRPRPFRDATYSEELSKAGIIGLARLSLGIFQVLGKPEAQDFQHTIQWLVGRANGNEGSRAVEIVPVLEIRCGFQQL